MLCAVRIGFRTKPVLRDRLFGVVLVAALLHGGYLVYPHPFFFCSIVILCYFPLFFLSPLCLLPYPIYPIFLILRGYLAVSFWMAYCLFHCQLYFHWLSSLTYSVQFWSLWCWKQIRLFDSQASFPSSGMLSKFDWSNNFTAENPLCGRWDYSFKLVWSRK